jgi:hypothetical protein
VLVAARQERLRKAKVASVTLFFILLENILDLSLFFERKCGRGSPYSQFFFLNKNPNYWIFHFC